MGDGLKFDCERCGGPIDQPGALVFSPPDGKIVAKLHLCVGCYDDLELWIEAQ